MQAWRLSGASMQWIRMRSPATSMVSPSMTRAGPVRRPMPSTGPGAPAPGRAAVSCTNCGWARRKEKALRGSWKKARRRPAPVPIPRAGEPSPSPSPEVPRARRTRRQEWPSVVWWVFGVPGQPEAAHGLRESMSPMRPASHAAALNRLNRRARRSRSGRSLARAGKLIVPPLNSFSASSIGPSC